MAVAHSLQGIIYALLNRQSTYADLGAAYFDQRDRHHTSQRLVARLERLGCRLLLALILFVKDLAALNPVYRCAAP